MVVEVRNPAFGHLLRSWRSRRGVSQLELALQAGVSQRHLSYVEVGRSKPSREMVQRLAVGLNVPLRERNSMLLAAGFAPLYPETPLDAEALLPVRHAIQKILSSHEPYPAVAVDRNWDVLWSNEPVRRIFAEGVAARLLLPRPNAIRVCLHPDGLAPQIVNFAEYAAHILGRLQHEAMIAPDPIAALFDEVRSYPTVSAVDLTTAVTASKLFLPLRIRALSGQELQFLSTIASFGTARDVTVAELAIESFFPADKATDAALRSTFT
jgi:transcriptional regulator with XRE-family HTH domain